MDKDDVEVVAFQGENTFYKHTLSKFYVFCILFILGIGSNFVSIVFSFAINPVSGTGWILFNVISGAISCHYMIQISNITKLESIFEIICFMGGGRASIIYFSFVFFSYYGIGASMNIAGAVANISYNLETTYSSIYSFPETNIILIAINILVLPFCFYKDVHKLKYYAVFLVFSNFLIFFALIIGSINSSPDNVNDTTSV
jgi:hypothetical protein